MTNAPFPSTLLQYPSAPESEWAATARYGVRPAPDGLALVQDFLNTRAGATTGIDLLGNANHANAWAGPAVHAWGARRGVAVLPPTMTEGDAKELGSVRDALDDALAGHGFSTTHQTLDVHLATTDAGAVLWTPTGHGWRWLTSAIFAEILLSQHAENWPPIKQCRNAACRATIYDSTWDNSAVWHNRSTCELPIASLRTATND